MPDNSFGYYLRELRNEKGITQEMLASKIGRKKMTISDFETGRNNPPQGELLERIIKNLNITEEEAQQLKFLAGKERNLLPNDVAEYFFSDPFICDALRIAKLKKLSGCDLIALVSSESRKEWMNV